MRIIVVTDAMSAGNYFKVWYKYYANLFGDNSIHVFTYLENRSEFEEYSLGGLHVLPDGYDDDLRIEKISFFISEILLECDIVIRVDVDEMLVADPSQFLNLRDYLCAWSGSHLSAFGFDLIQSPEEADLDLSVKVLSQRRTAYALTALNKTSVTRVPLNWGRGFHYCSLPPTFGSLYLFHLKRADIGLQADWNFYMRSASGGNDFVKSYYSWERQNVIEYHVNRFNLPTVEGPTSMLRTEFNDAFLQSIRFGKNSRLFDGPYEIESVNVMIPDSFLFAF